MITANTPLNRIVRLVAANCQATDAPRQVHRTLNALQSHPLKTRSLCPYPVQFAKLHGAACDCQPMPSETACVANRQTTLCTRISPPHMNALQSHHTKTKKPMPLPSSICTTTHRFPRILPHHFQRGWCLPLLFAAFSFV